MLWRSTPAKIHVLISKFLLCISLSRRTIRYCCSLRNMSVGNCKFYTLKSKIHLLYLPHKFDIRHCVLISKLVFFFVGEGHVRGKISKLSVGVCRSAKDLHPLESLRAYQRMQKIFKMVLHLQSSVLVFFFFSSGDYAVFIFYSFFFLSSPAYTPQFLFLKCEIYKRGFYTFS